MDSDKNVQAVFEKSSTIGSLLSDNVTRTVEFDVEDPNPAYPKLHRYASLDVKVNVPYATSISVDGFGPEITNIVGKIKVLGNEHEITVKDNTGKVVAKGTTYEDLSVPAGDLTITYYIEIEFTTNTYYTTFQLKFGFFDVMYYR